MGKTPFNYEVVARERIADRPVAVDLDERQAYYFRHESAPRHPDAAITVPDPKHKGWKVDIILLVVLVLIAACVFMAAAGQLPALAGGL